MNKTFSKSGLAVVLSHLKSFSRPKVLQEQYSTDSEVAASVLWNAYQLGDIKNKIVADLGCGTGILGIGAGLLGAKEVLMIDNDKEALQIAKDNIAKLKSEGYNIGTIKIVYKNIKEVDLEADAVVQNPPFGTKIRHTDIIFLEKALKIAPIVYSFHKSEGKPFLERFSAKKSTRITHIWGFKFPIKATMGFHRRQIHRIDVSCFRFEKVA